LATTLKTYPEKELEVAIQASRLFIGRFWYEQYLSLSSMTEKTVYLEQQKEIKIQSRE